MQDRAVADSPCPHSVETKPGYITACVLHKQRGLGRTSLQVVTVVGVASEWETILFSHNFIGVKVQTLIKTSLNVSLEHFMFSCKMVNYGQLMFTTYLSEQFLVMLFHSVIFLQQTSGICSAAGLCKFTLSYHFVLYLSLNLSLLFAQLKSKSEKGVGGKDVCKNCFFFLCLG